MIVSGALLALALLYVGSPTGATQPYAPTLEFVSISNSAPSANADITFRTSLPAGHHILGTYGLEVASWGIAGHSNQLTGDVTAVATMAINLEPDGNCNDGDTGTPQNFGPFPLLDQDPGPQGPHALWGGVITDFADGNPSTNWTLTFVVEPSLDGFMLDTLMTDAVLPAGNTLCTPQTVTLTFCGRANPASTATTCGSGSNQVVMTNPSLAACYVWTLVTTDESGQHSANPQVGVPIGAASCPTPTPSPTPGATPTPTATATASPTPSPTPTPPPGDNDGDGVPNAGDNCPWWWNPTQVLPPWTVVANDPDCDGFSSAVESPVGTNATVQCGFNAWPADINNDTFSDIFDISELTANFAVSVPPAPARHNIAPDPPDGFVDIFDVSEMTAFFALTCAPCPGDFDCDLVANASDNCPNWSNPTQILPPWPVPPNDPDCDGFSTAVETSAGTAQLTHCGPNAWPADINNDTFSDIFDISELTANFGVSVPPAPARHNISPDPPDGFVDIFDVSEMTAFFALSCS